MVCMENKTYLEKIVKTFLEEEYDIKDLNISIGIKGFDGKKEDMIRFSHDATSDYDYYLKEETKC